MPKRSTITLSATAALTLSCVFAAAGFAWLISRETSFQHAVTIVICGGAVLAGILTLGTNKLDDLQKALTVKPGRIAGVMAVLWGVYLIFSVGLNTAHVQSLLGMAMYLWVPFLLLTRIRGSSQASWLDAVTILWVWLPLEFGIVRRLIMASPPDVNFQYTLAEGLALNMGIAAFAGWRRLPEIGYRFEFNRKTISTALLHFLLFAAIAIPLGFGIHFIRYSFELRKLLLAPAAFLGIFLFVAVPEEFLFRGLLQNWFERAAAHRSGGLILASVVFGASHLNNGPPIPNYKYFLMASIAGIFYGLVWQRTGSVAASALTHALVDTVWSAIFR